MLRVLTLATLFPDAGRPEFGGFVERQTLALAALDDVEVEVVSPVALPTLPLSLHPRFEARRRLPEREEWKGLAVHRPRFRSWPGDKARAMAAAALPAARAFRPDAIDAEFFWPDGVAAMHLAEALGVPFSVKGRGSDIHFWGTRPAVRRRMVQAAGRAAGLLAVSDALKCDMAAIGMPAARIRVHHTGIDLAAFRPIERAAAKAALGVDGSFIVSVGALIPLKGHRLVIDALEQLPGVTWIAAGDGPERPALERLARERRLADRVRCPGAVPHERLPELLAAADAMVLPSEREGLANAWVEALACGTPIVIGDVGGAREVVDRPEAGRIVAREPGAIAAAVREMLADPPDPAAVRQSAERFSWTRNAAELRDHLAGLSLERH